MLETILTAVFAAVLPALVIYVLTQLLKVNAWLDKLPGLVKQVVVAVEAVLLSYLGAATGMPLPPDLGLFTPEIVQAAVTTLFAFLIHKLFKAPPMAA